MEIINSQLENKKARTYKMLLLFGMISIAMMFAGLTSAYIVSKSRPDWLTDFQLPSAFLYSTFIILASSISFYLAQKTIQRDHKKRTSILLFITLFLGIFFVITQFIGFEEIIAEGYFFTGSESTITTSFLYIVVVVHLIHLFGGLLAIIIVIYNHFKQKYNSSQTTGIELSAMFWHFLGFLWVYLYLFLYFFK